MKVNLTLFAMPLMSAAAVLSAGTYVSRNPRMRAGCCGLHYVRSRRSPRLRYHQLVFVSFFITAQDRTVKYPFCS